MRLPRVTIRRLLLLVAATAVVLGILVALQRRSERFRQRAAEYASAIHTVYFADVNGEDGMVLTASGADYHADLSMKYEAAANRPCLHSNRNRRRPTTSRPSGSHMQRSRRLIPVSDSETTTLWSLWTIQRTKPSGPSDTAGR